MTEKIQSFINEINRLADFRVQGTVTSVKGLLIECNGIAQIVSVGSKCKIIARNGRQIAAEVVGVKEKTSSLMVFSDLEGIGAGCPVFVETNEPVVFPDIAWKGRVINAFGEPIDGKGPLPQGAKPYLLRSKPPQASQRQLVKGKIDLGVKAVNTFVTCCKGQRLGIFSGSGVGKSVMISMMARYSEADVKVIGLIGERGREVQEFVQDYLGEEGLKNSVVIIATSDESALMRRQAAYLTLAISEYFRDEEQAVLCFIDSVTRFAMAQREIGLSIGEPPASKGYTPTVFSELPKLLERAGPGIGKGTITGLFSVLVEGDDHNEPIADAVRGILDGHIVLERIIAERGRFPAINVLKSISRTMPGCNNDEENSLVERAKTLLSTYDNMAEMIRLGAYKKGSDKGVDEAMFYFPLIENFLKQNINERGTIASCYEKLKEILATKRA